MAFPGAIPGVGEFGVALVNPQVVTKPTEEADADQKFNTPQAELIAVCNKIGVDGSAVVTSHSFMLGGRFKSVYADGGDAFRGLMPVNMTSGNLLVLGDNCTVFPTVYDPKFVVDWDGNVTAGRWLGSPIAHWTMKAKSANYTCAIGEGVVCDTSGGGFTLTIPTAVGNSGKAVWLKKKSADANTLTVAATAGNIDGAGSLAIIAQNVARTLVSDGADWWIE